MIVSDLIKAVAEEFCVDPVFLIGPQKPKIITPARYALYTILVRRGMSRKRAGKVCGGRDHTTIMHGLDRAREMMNKDQEYRSKIERLVALKDDPIPKHLIAGVGNRSRKRTHTDYCEVEFD